MSDCRFGVSPVNYPDPDPDPEDIYDKYKHATITTKLRNVINVSLLRLKYILIISLRTGESASIFQ